MSLSLSKVCFDSWNQVEIKLTSLKWLKFIQIAWKRVQTSRNPLEFRLVGCSPALSDHDAELVGAFLPLRRLLHLWKRFKSLQNRIEETPKSIKEEQKHVISYRFIEGIPCVFEYIWNKKRFKKRFPKTLCVTTHASLSAMATATSWGHRRGFGTSGTARLSCKRSLLEWKRNKQHL